MRQAAGRTKPTLSTAEPMAGLGPAVALALALAGTAVGGHGRLWAADDGPPRPEAGMPAPVVAIDVSFKMDPRLTRGLYMGDRWISPPTYLLNAPGPGAGVEARAHAVDAGGGRVDVMPTWTPADPEMVSVTPGDRSGVTIVVHRRGESGLKVSAGGASRDLTVRAGPRGAAFQVEIVQVPLEGTPEAAERARILAGAKERASYALGVKLGRNLTGQSLDLDADLLAKGVRDALEGGPALLTEKEFETALVAHRERLQSRRTSERLAERRKEVAERSEERIARRMELAAKNKTEGEVFLAGNKARKGVVTLESGLQYRVLTEGEGAKPTADDTVVCHYRGTLLDGAEFDSSRERQKPRTFALKRVIQGWREALPLMPVGSKWELFVPPELAYGVRGTRTIPPDSTLVFEVELLSIQEKAQGRHGRERSTPDGASTDPAIP